MSAGSGRGARRATELSIQRALRRYMKQAPLPFAITRGAGHNLVYANSAFYRFAGVPSVEIGVSIATIVDPAERRALIALLDRAFQQGVDLLDHVIESSGELAAGWKITV